MNNTISVLNKNIDKDKVNNPKLKQLIGKILVLDNNDESMLDGQAQYDDEYVDYYDNCYKDGGWG